MFIYQILFYFSSYKDTTFFYLQHFITYLFFVDKQKNTNFATS